jgi:Ca2+-binding EF-hand superfamily protein
MLIKGFNGHKQAAGGDGTPVTEYLANSCRSADKDGSGSIQATQLVDELQKEGITITACQASILQQRFGGNAGGIDATPKIEYMRMLQFVKDGVASPNNNKIPKLEESLIRQPKLEPSQQSEQLTLQFEQQTQQSEQQPQQSEQSMQRSELPKPKIDQQLKQRIDGQPTDEQDLEPLKNLFDKLDKDSSGTVDKQEWGRALSQNKEALAQYFAGETLSEIGKQFNRIDADQSGDLSWAEVESAVADQRTQSAAQQAAQQQQQQQAAQQQPVVVEQQVAQQPVVGELAAPVVHTEMEDKQQQQKQHQKQKQQQKQQQKQRNGAADG